MKEREIVRVDGEFGAVKVVYRDDEYGRYKDCHYFFGITEPSFSGNSESWMMEEISDFDGFIKALEDRKEGKGCSVDIWTNLEITYLMCFDYDAVGCALLSNEQMEELTSKIRGKFLSEGEGNETDNGELPSV